jgi:hypothetical protein
LLIFPFRLVADLIFPFHLVLIFPFHLVADIRPSIHTVMPHQHHRPVPVQIASNTGSIGGGQIRGGSSTKGTDGTHCATASEGETVMLSCADSSQRAIASIDFAVFGSHTTGSCGNHVADASLAASACSTTSFSALLAGCVGEATCDVAVALDQLAPVVVSALAACVAKDSAGHWVPEQGAAKRVLTVEYTCGYTSAAGVWVDVDLAMLQRDSASDEIKLSDAPIATGCDMASAEGMRTAWVPPADDATAAIGSAGRHFLGFPSASCDDGSTTFGVLRWKATLPFTFTAVRGKFKLRSYGAQYGAASATRPVDSDGVESCSWDDGAALVGPNKVGFVLFGTPDQMLYCGGRGGTIPDGSARTVGVSEQTVPATNALQWQVAADGSDRSVVLSSVILQVWYPITPNIEGISYRFGFDTPAVTFTDQKQQVQVHAFKPSATDPSIVGDDVQKLVCGDPADTMAACPAHHPEGSGALYWSPADTSTSKPLTFASPSVLGLSVAGDGTGWSFVAWIRPEFRNALRGDAVNTIYLPAMLFCGRSAASGGDGGSATDDDANNVCLGIVNGRAAVTVDGDVRCAVFDRILRSRMPSDPTHVLLTYV